MKLKIEYVDTDDIKPHPKNTNKHTTEQIDKLVRTFEIDGFRDPLVVSRKTNYIISGHGRYEAAKKHGIIEIPVVFQEFRDETHEIECMIRFNSLAEYSFLDLEQIDSIIKESDINIDELFIQNFNYDFEDANDAFEEWEGMPEYDNEDLSAKFSTKVNFRDENDMKEFAKLIGQKLTNKTRSIWYPEKERAVLKDKFYE